MTLLDRVLGRPLASSEEDEQKIGVLAGIPMLGLDGLSSSAYGPEAALTILLPLGALGLRYIGPIIIIILLILGILYLSYRQTIAAYPTGGGSYTVASENLGTGMGLLAAAALLLDYILNVAVGIAAGVGALVSAVPSLHPHILALCLIILALITLVNLRGARESGMVFALPTYLFVGSLSIVLAIGVAKTFLNHGHPVAVTAPSALPVATGTVTLWLLMRSFASGCTAMTGVEAVSNGVSAFAKPAVQNAQRTLTAIVLILGLLLGGIAYLSLAYHIGAVDPDSPQYQSVISQLVTAIVGRGVAYYITIGSVLAVLALSANTSFAGFPRLCRLLAQDNFMPHAFANRGRRLVYTLGIMILAGLSAVLLIAFGGITDRLIPLFAVGAFLAFTLSQAGMVFHWRRVGGGPHASVARIINAIGALCTAVALAVILAAKFMEGAWVTVLLIPAMLWLFIKVRAHYDEVLRETDCERPLNLSNIQPPVVVVPIKRWDTIAEKALRFALQLSPTVIGAHIGWDDEEATQLRAQWVKYVDGPAVQMGLTPRLELVSSPYRRLFTPLLEYINGLKDEYPGRMIAVIIPELIEPRWYNYFLHNQRAAALKAALLLWGDQRVVVINVPWYFGAPDDCIPPPTAAPIPDKIAS